MQSFSKKDDLEGYFSLLKKIYIYKCSMRFGAVAKCVLLKYEYEHNELCVRLSCTQQERAHSWLKKKKKMQTDIVYLKCTSEYTLGGVVTPGRINGARQNLDWYFCCMCTIMQTPSNTMEICDNVRLQINKSGFTDPISRVSLVSWCAYTCLHTMNHKIMHHFILGMFLLVYIKGAVCESSQKSSKMIIRMCRKTRFEVMSRVFL